MSLPTIEDIQANMPPTRNGILMILEEQGVKEYYKSDHGKWIKIIPAYADLTEQFHANLAAGRTPDPTKSFVKESTDLMPLVSKSEVPTE